MFKKITDKERLKIADGEINNLKTMNNELMLTLVELDMQRDMDKLENELAIVELAETILGGMQNG